MKKYFIALILMLGGIGLTWALPHQTQAAATGPQVVIVQIKVTSSNGQFITLYNNTDNIIDLSSIQLEYFNNFDLLKATSGKLINLSGRIAPHGFAVVNDGPIQACSQMTVDSASLGMSTTSGFLQ